MRLPTLCFIATVLWAGWAGGQTTQPSQDPWSTSVNQFARALEQRDAAALASLVTDDVAINSLENKLASALQLLARIDKGSLVLARAYVQAPQSMAADIAAAVGGAQLPDEVKQEMALRTESHERRANATAARWMGETLTAKDGDHVATLVFWCHSDTQQLSEGEIVFVLVKGYIPAGGRPRIITIAFGNPRTWDR